MLPVYFEMRGILTNEPNRIWIEMSAFTYFGRYRVTLWTQ